ncbi:uncharacterized protein LOC120354516 [Nilaparvata lugens]|uniref:uncharacterized protein LOC120354516 n=1 Tax=Nilaparvata lugens TaxID=108931 RepID=UPI00193D5267|nr:uncharacterized protein LOC120354516 [Nilaparvata lugens]
MNVYKPPSSRWEQNTLTDVTHPAVCVGDFNSRHTDWGYSSCNPDSEYLARWAALGDLALVYDAKQGGSFHSARWAIPTNPDLCFMTRDVNNLPLPTSQLYLRRFPRSQHRPIVTTIGLTIPVVKSTPVSRWNLKKADW